MLLRNALLRIAGLCAALVMVAGCSTLSQKLVSPELSLLGIQMLSTDMFAQKFKVRVLVKNPNDLEVPIRGIEYTIILMGDSFAEGVSKDQFLLPARGEAEFDMLVTTNFVSSFGRLLSRVGGGKLQDLNYEIAGAVLVDKGMIRKIPFSHQGTVDISRVQGQPKKGET
ncbi:MAG: LEA type 2 family protein [Gammaproteobacteria bacterium]|nr:LEA type 2 family protein [Gammaproteobacteria bacterium]MDH4311346.1 LEA type 2 family protein [Gammaproteobacteria bacterium]MDH5273925.1 LEA type 2 family protein [Gammaproteobacteria bacterium]